MSLRHTLLAAALLAVSIPGAVFAQEPTVAELRVFPEAVNLLTSKDRQLMVVQAVYTDGLTRDVASKATFTFANPALVRKDASTLWPAADGTTELKVEFGGK